MSQIAPFRPTYNFYDLAVTQTQHAPVNIVGDGVCSNYLIYNFGPNPCFIVMGQTSTLPAINLVGDGLPGGVGLFIPINTPLVISAVANAWLIAVCSAGNTASLYIAPGEGFVQ